MICALCGRYWTEAVDQRTDEAWMHAACLTIAETGQKWGESVHPSPAMRAVYSLFQKAESLKAAAREAKAALYGCREVLGSVANIQHAIDLLTAALGPDPNWLSGTGADLGGERDDDPPLPKARPAWIEAAAIECGTRVLVGEGGRAFAEIIERHWRGAT